MKPTEFISWLAPFAIQTMRESQVLASLTLAQAALESNWGESELTTKHNNFFGIKGTGDNGSVSYSTTEYVNGKPKKIMADFASYKTPKSCFDRRAELFKNGVSWDKEKYRNILGVTDYAVAARLLQKDGYATDPYYADKLIALIQANKLDQYDKQGAIAAELSEKNEALRQRAIAAGITDGKNPLATPNNLYLWSAMLPLMDRIAELEKLVKKG